MNAERLANWVDGKTREALEDEGIFRSLLLTCLTSINVNLERQAIAWEQFTAAALRAEERELNS